MRFLRHRVLPGKDRYLHDNRGPTVRGGGGGEKQDI